MNTLTQSALSTVYVCVPVKAVGSKGQPINPTGDTAQMAFTTVGVNPGPSDWHAASWDVWMYPQLQYVAKCLVGPNSAVNLSAGTYTGWLKVTDSPEIPVIAALTLVIT